jgi:hypothetical protein
MKKIFTATLLIPIALMPELSKAGEYVYYDGSDPSLLTTVNGVNSSLAPKELTSVNGNTITVNIPLGSTASIAGDVYGGFTDSDEDVTNNTVNISSIGQGLTGDIYGGYSKDGNAIGNTVNISYSGKGLGNLMYGGYSEKGNATGNTVNISSGNFSYTSIYGGSSLNGNATANTVNISSGNFSYTSIYGGSSLNGNATANTVNISGGSVNDVYGGYTYGDGNAIANTVNISNGRVSQRVYGGYSQNGNATGNTVNISGGIVASGPSILYGLYRQSPSSDIYGGYSRQNGDATGNTVNISGGGISGRVYGGGVGLNGDGNATANTVNISGGSVGASVYGGSSFNGNATANTVNISGGSVAGNVYGGGNDTSGNGNGNATANTVNISGGSISGNVYGGQVGLNGDGNATGNTVNLFNGATINGTLFGGFAGGSNNTDRVFNNTLNVQAFEGSVRSLANFDHYNFVLPGTLTNGDTQIHIIGAPVDLAGTEVAITDIQGGGPALHPGDTLTLIDKTTNTPAVFSRSNLHKGMSLIYNFSMDDVAESPNALKIKLLNVETNPQTKALSEGQLAAVALINQGSNQVAEMTRTLAANKPKNETIPFGSMNGGNQRNNTGSHVDVNGASLLTGVARVIELADNPWLLGAFVEAGWGRYDSNNSFSNAASVAGNGNTRYYGGGVLSRYDLARGIYVDGAVRAGQVNTSFNSKDLCDPAGYGRLCANYETSAGYYGAQAGLGYLWSLHDKLTLDLSTRYLWTHQNSDSVTVVNDPIDFAAINSQRWHSGLRLNYLTESGFSPYVGVAYEYEFSGQADAKAYSFYNIDAPTLKGGTGIGELGINVLRNGKKGMGNMKLNVGLEAYTGQREGINGVLGFSYAFSAS